MKKIEKKFNFAVLEKPLKFRLYDEDGRTINN